MREVGALFSLVVLLAAPAHADKQEDALRLLDEGVALFNAGELEAARTALIKARDLVPEKANPYRWLGLVDARLGRCADAVEELGVFLTRVAPEDPRAAEAVALRDRCRDELKPKLGTLVVDSTPTGAEVRLDVAGSPPVGVTPYRNDALAAGNHVVFVGKPGFVGAAQGVAINRGETVQVQIVLQEAPPPPTARDPETEKRLAAELALSAHRDEEARSKRLARAERVGFPLRLGGGLGVAAGFLLAGLAFAVVPDGQDANNAVRRAQDSGSWSPDGNAALARGRSDTASMIALWSTGGALVVAGSVVAIVGAALRARAVERARMGSP